MGTGELDRTKSPAVETAVSEKRLRTSTRSSCEVPDSFTIHRKLRKPLLSRVEKLDQGDIEFGHAEALAFASLLTEGTHIRLTGQDTERGTFSHRHLALHDENTGLRYVPIQNLSGALAPFELHNSPLSEAACLGFEYGYSAASPESLILWEAQFGDFANSAQVIIDQFIVAGESKWGQTTRPHPPAPARLRGRRPRALQRPASSASSSSAPRATSASPTRRPRPVLPPPPPPGADRKAAAARGLHAQGPAAAAGRGVVAGGAHLRGFQLVLDDPRAADRREEIDRLVLCNGKLFYDIDGHDRRETATTAAVARVELLYPFARNELQG